MTEQQIEILERYFPNGFTIAFFEPNGGMHYCCSKGTQPFSYSEIIVDDLTKTMKKRLIEFSPQHDERQSQ